MNNMYSDQDLHNTINKITNTASLFSFNPDILNKGIIGKLDNVVVCKKKPNSERAEMIEQLCEFMGDKRFKYWLGRTKKLKPQQIYDYMKQAKTGKNPQALFNWLIKQKCTKQK